MPDCLCFLLIWNSIHLSKWADCHKCLPKTHQTLVWHFFSWLSLKETVENVPFGGSRLFSVNTDKLNHYNPVPSSGVVLIRSDWKCVRAQTYRDKRVCILRAGFGGIVHVLHRMESYSEINCQAKWSISAFRRRQSHNLTHTQLTLHPHTRSNIQKPLEDNENSFHLISDYKKYEHQHIRSTEAVN